jgi:hypothetical protein
MRSGVVKGENWSGVVRSGQQWIKVWSELR